jgi:multiple sugar transport system ATP-binding protein
MSVTIDHLHKIFDGPDGGQITAVDDFSIDIEQGEFIVFVGPSGCGKTTTLRCIAGLEGPTEGRIYLNGDDITDQPPQERDIAMVFQNYALYPHLSVRENIGFGLKNRTNLSKEERNERVEEIAELMDITDLLDKNPGDLSGGQQQRVATGRAIVRDPEVFLFDEPLSNLDANLRKHMRTEIQQLQNEFGTTSIYVTHDQEEAMTMADRIVVLKNGALQQIGAPTEVYNYPVNRFVADFIGEPSMNFFDVTVEDDRLVHDHFEYEISSTVQDTIEGVDRLTLGVRPEDIHVASDGGIGVTVEVLEELGSQNLLNVSFGGDQMYIVEVETSVAPDNGESLNVTFAEDDIYLFDGRTHDTILARGKKMADRREMTAAQ